MGVADTAKTLAQRYGEDAEKAYIAGLLHDCAKRYKTREMIGESKKRGIKPDGFELQSPGTLHAKLSEVIAREEFGVTDPRILQAIRLHIYGAPDMTRLDILLNLADYTEPGRTFPEVARIRELALMNPEKALFVALRGTMLLLVNGGQPLNPGTVITYNALYGMLHETQEAVR